MSNLTLKTATALKLSEYQNPFEELFKKGLNFQDYDSVESKIKFLSLLCRTIEKIEGDAENNLNFLTWSGIGTAISGVATLIILPAFIPVIGVSTLAVIAGSFFKTRTEAQTIDIVKRYRLALTSAELLSWATLWQSSGTENFLDALHESSTGEIVDGELYRKENSIDSAINYLAAINRKNLPDFLQVLSAIKSGGSQAATTYNLRSNCDTPQIHPVSTMPLEALPHLSANYEQSNAMATDDKHLWVEQVLKMPFRVLTGDAGSGKSTLERFMISKLKEAGYHVVCINVETNPNVWKGVEVLTTANEINEFFSEFVGGIESRQKQCRALGIDEDDFLSQVASKKTGRDGRVAIFFMESNTFELCGVDPDLWATVLKMSLTNIRKWGYTACLTAQSDNQSSISSKLKGFASRYDEQPRVECIGEQRDFVRC
jgi:hypothetical protein